MPGRARRAAQAIALLIVLTSACQRGGSEKGAQQKGPSRPPPDRVLRVGVRPLAGFDPVQARRLDELLVADQLFDSLTAIDPRTTEPVPSLAARWQASPDQRQWDFFLRPGATFSNGRPINPGDVKYSLERVARPGSGSAAIDLLQPVSGFEAFGKGTAPQLAGITTPGPDVVHISLDQPLAVLPSVLANPVFGVVPKEAVEAQPPAPSFAEQPVTSGPFQLRGEEGANTLLVPGPGSKARLAGIELVELPDETAMYKSFTQGQLDVTRVPAGEVPDAARRFGRQGFRPFLAEMFFLFNLKSPKFADIRFREAIVRAIDRRAILDVVYQGQARALEGLVVEGVAGQQPGACPRCAHDPGRARALLAEAFPGRAPPEIAIDYDDDPTHETMAKAMQANLREVGITATPRPRPAAQYSEVLLSGEQELFRVAWIAPYASADAFLFPLFSSGARDNLTGFANPGIDALLRAARSQGEPGERTRLYREAERAILDQMPLVPIAQSEVHFVIAKRVRDLRVTSMGIFDASVVSLGRG